MAEPKVVGATAALQRSMAATSARIALGNMLEFRAALVREMPGKMDSSRSWSVPPPQRRTHDRPQVGEGLWMHNARGTP